MGLDMRVVLNALCTILPIITFASPATLFIPALIKISPSNFSSINHDDVIEMPPLALTSQMLQCFLFAIYAHHLHMRTLLIPNVGGFVLGFVWSTVYPFKIAHEEGLLRQWKIQYTVAMILMLLGLLTIHWMPYFSSTIAAAVGVLMCTYPLASMKQANKDSNAKLMGSAIMNFAMFTTCFVWAIHSSWLVEYDVFVLVSNAAGVIVQGSALVLRLILKKRTRVASEGVNSELSSLSPVL